MSVEPGSPVVIAGECEQLAIEGSFGALLEPGEWSALRALGRTHGFPAGAVLMYQGEPSDRIMIVLSGRVKVTRTGHDGREQLLSIRDPGEIVGELSFIDHQPRLGTVTALEPLEALIVAAADFRVFLERTPRVAVALLQSLTQRVRETTIKRSEFGALDAIGRVAARLAELAERYGEPCEQGTAIGLPLTQEELGAFAGASPAGLAKALQTLRELGWIETERRRIVVCELEALRQRSR